MENLRETVFWKLPKKKINGEILPKIDKKESLQQKKSVKLNFFLIKFSL